MPATDSRAARLKARESKRLLLSKKISKNSKEESKRRAAGGPDSCSAPGCTKPPLPGSQIKVTGYDHQKYKFEGWCGSPVCVRVVCSSTGTKHVGVAHAPDRAWEEGLPTFNPHMRFVMDLRKLIEAAERAENKVAAFIASYGERVEDFDWPDYTSRAYESTTYHTGYTTPSYTPSDGHADDTIPGNYSPTCPSYSPVDGYDSTDSA